MEWTLGGAFVAHQTVLYGPLAGCATPEERRPDPGCPVEVTLAALRGRWTPLILQEFLRGGGLAFSELAAALPGLSAKVLTERLAQLTDAGVLDRTRTAAWPPRVRYTLTERGRELTPILAALWEWGADA
jgi:DNA-binding HxlR family transcriptional regulator